MPLEPLSVGTSRRQWQPTPILLPGKSHGRRSLVQSVGSLRVGHDCSTSLSLFLSCIGEGNGNLLQCSCLENPRDGGAWWAAIYRVAQGRTQLKRLSSSSCGYQTLLTLPANIQHPQQDVKAWPQWPRGWGQSKPSTPHCVIVCRGP